jgi:hypothetical protein
MMMMEEKEMIRESISGSGVDACTNKEKMMMIRVNLSTQVVERIPPDDGLTLTLT